MNRRFDGRQLGVVQKPATQSLLKTDEIVQVARFRAPPPDVERPS